MGHANLSNISRTFNRMVKRPDGATIREIVADLVANNEKVHASEGDYDDDGMLSYACEEVASELKKAGMIEASPETEQQTLAYQMWEKEGVCAFEPKDGMQNLDELYAILDSIRWKALKKRLPILDNFTN